MEERLRVLERKLDSVIVKISELENRLSALEKRFGTPRAPRPAPSQDTSVKHTYLTRAIMAAKKEYEKGME